MHTSSYMNIIKLIHQIASQDIHNWTETYLNEKCFQKGKFAALETSFLSKECKQMETQHEKGKKKNVGYLQPHVHQLQSFYKHHRLI